MNDHPGKHPASFRDPSGFVFEQGGKIYRQVNQLYKEHFDHLVNSGLYSQLTQAGLLVQHDTIQKNLLNSPDWYLTLIPERIPFISYPYEWSFDQLKDAAMLTLKIMRKALDKGMILKDATPYNIQFNAQARPVFIDTLSFESYAGHQPWVAYRQFCETFLAPLLLNAYLGMESSRLFFSYPDGVPVQQCASWLRFKSRFHSLALLHIHLQKAVTNGRSKVQQGSFTKAKLLRIVEHLDGGISKLKLPERRTEWNQYYDPLLTGSPYIREKEKVFAEYVGGISFSSAIDLGCNNGYFTRMLSTHERLVVGTDFDNDSINDFYAAQKKEGNAHHCLPLVADWLHPAASSGWENAEQKSLIDRSSFDLVVALALIHHLTVARNVPLEHIVSLLSKICRRWLIIEFVTKEDERVIDILERKEDRFLNYNPAGFEKIFSGRFNLIRKTDLKQGHRMLYLFEKKPTHG